LPAAAFFIKVFHALMVTVASLVTDTIWSPGSAYDGKSPALSIFLPTFRRAANGMLQRAIDSIRKQTFTDFELIVIDDASTDGSADIIRRAMAQDGRISCLRHPHNIGLPAISEFEAYTKSRGRLIGFAFDDFVFEPTAYEGLVAASRSNPEALMHGYVEMVGWEGEAHILGKNYIPYSRLWQANFIANAAVLMPRQMIEEVGLFDPHILAARNCDWDLWRRVHRRYPIVPNPIFVGKEYGPEQTDSIGRTYPVFQEMMSTFYCGRVLEELLPANLPNRDVWSVPENASSPLVAATLATQKFFKSKPWAASLPVDARAEIQVMLKSRRAIIGIVGRLNASTTLCFDGLLDEFGKNFQIIEWQDLTVTQTRDLVICDAIILSRALFDHISQRVIDYCRQYGIDLYYLIDDNLIVLATEDPIVADYTLDKVRSALEPFKAVLTTSPPLHDYFATNHLHHDIRSFGPTFDRATLEKVRKIPREPHPGLLRIGFIGGDFRLAGLQAKVHPALEQLSRQTRVEFIARASDKRAKPPSTVEWRRVSRVDSYDTFIQRWRAFGIDALVHPEGQTLNIDYKTNSVLLAALYIGAVPIITDEAAFAGVGPEQGAIKVAGGPDEWARAIGSISDPDFKREMLSRLERFCLRQFDPISNAQVIHRILDDIKPLDIIDYHERLTTEFARMVAIAGAAQLEFTSRTYRAALILRRLAVKARNTKKRILDRSR
jgi:glycosyltransferase involved in cell wall biosynthesis